MTFVSVVPSMFFVEVTVVSSFPMTGEGITDPRPAPAGAQRGVDRSAPCPF